MITLPESTWLTTPNHRPNGCLGSPRHWTSTAAPARTEATDQGSTRWEWTRSGVARSLGGGGGGVCVCARARACDNACVDVCTRACKHACGCVWSVMIEWRSGKGQDSSLGAPGRGGAATEPARDSAQHTHNATAYDDTVVPLMHPHLRTLTPSSTTLSLHMGRYLDRWYSEGSMCARR